MDPTEPETDPKLSVHAQDRLRVTTQPGEDPSNQSHFNPANPANSVKPDDTAKAVWQLPGAQSGP